MKKQIFVILALFIFLFGKVNALPVPGNETTTNTATTIVLSNEEGKLIDQLIAAGYGEASLYETLVALQNTSGGVISNKFLEVLRACPAGSPIFTQKLRDYAGISGGVAINKDGTVFTTSIKGRSYYGQTGYSTYPPNHSGVGRELFTYANSPEYYINAENGGKTYKVFAVAWSFGEAPQPTTFVLSNEEGGLIDQLIELGYGHLSLYRALIAIQESSGGVISDEFLDVLANCPAGSPIFTKKLKDYEGITGGIAINTVGTVFSTSIKGRSYYGQTGYSTHPPGQFGMGRELFTYANSPAYYIDAKSGNTTYKVFAIGWSSNQFPTFMLSNEEGGLIDKLIADGHGDESLYEVLQILQPISGGAIPADYMAALAACPADCEAKTAKLSNFSSKFNNPIGIGAEGKLIVAQIHGRDYYGDAGFSTTTGNIAGVGTVLFTSADSESDYVDAGTLVSGGVTYFYKAFAIGWMPADAITVAGTATDDTAILQINNKTPSVRDNTWDINVTTGTVKAGVSASDVTLTGLPAGLNYTAAKGTGNNIVITLTGAATTALTGDATITAVIKGSAVTETGARDSEGISLKLWYVGAGTTIVISNESGGYLIDKLIAAGHGDDSLYEVLELLQPNFSSVITERFMKTLDSTPAGGEVFTVALSNFAGLNNPVCVNADGTLSIQAIFGRDYNGDTGYTTTQSNLTGIGAVSLTTADDAAHLIHAGVMEVSAEGTRYYKAFAILWMPADAITVAGTATDDTAILQINNKTPSVRDNTWD
ncbi:MAG: hypothetical protein WAZ38_12755, partial [Prolixibacteraceae bacterium]